MTCSLPGENNPNAKFTAATARNIRALWRRGDLTCKEIAEQYGCSARTIYSIVRGESYKPRRFSRVDNRERSTKKGERHPSHKLSEDQVIEIRRLLADGALTKTAIGELFGIHRRQVHRIDSRASWRHLK